MRDFLYGFRVAWASTASVVIGALLYFYAAQVHDLFLETKGNLVEDAKYWAAFYLSVVVGWSLPVFVSSRWILKRFEEGPLAHRNVPPVKVWVRRRLPLWLGAACFAAVFLGQLMAIRSAPSVGDPALQEYLAGARTGTIGQVAAKSCFGESYFRGEGQFRTFVCLLSAAPGTVAALVGDSIANTFGRDLVPLIAYAAAAFMIFWFYFASPSKSDTNSPIRIVRLYVVSICVFVFLTIFGIILTYPILEAFIPSLLNNDWPLIAICVTTLVLTIALAWFGTERVMWWVATLSAIPLAALVGLVLYGFVSLELQSTFGVAHLVLLPAMTAAVGASLWWALGPRDDGRASRLGHLLVWLGGRRGIVDEDTATAWLIKPLFHFLLILTALIIVVLMIVHPLNVTDRLQLHRALLLPLLLGAPVAVLTWMSHWSARVRAPLTFAGVLALGALTPYWGEDHKIRVVPMKEAAAPMSLSDAVKDWKAANCDSKNSLCPAPIIVVASGGASRSAFQVAGALGTLLDEQRFSPLRGHSKGLSSASFSPDGKLILTASSDGTARIWSAESGKEIAALRDEFDGSGASFSPDGKRIMAVSNAGKLRIWDALQPGAPLLLSAQIPVSSANAAAFSPDGRRIVIASNDAARIVDAESGNVLLTLEIYVDARNGAGGKVLSFQLVNAATFSPDGKRIVTASSDDMARVWDAESGQLIHELKGHADTVTSASFSPNGRQIVTGSWDRMVRIWDAESGTLLSGWTAHASTIWAASFSPDGRRIVTTSADNTARVWDSEMPRLLILLRGHSDSVQGASFSPDGARVVTASSDGTARVWNALTEERHAWTVQDQHPFSRRLFAISAVSGGALGAAVTYAALADKSSKIPSANIGVMPPCGKESLVDKDWFASLVKGASLHQADPTKSWRDCLQLLVAGDFLSPVFLTLVGTDMLRIERWRGNRAAVLENAWEIRYARMTGQTYSLGLMAADSGNSTLAQPLSSIRANASGWLPILLLNGTSVETGKRIITSDIDTRRLFHDAYDLHELMESKTTGEDVRLSTAVTMSARFPLISPPGGIPQGKAGPIIDRVVDGGYYENFGATTAKELVAALRKLGDADPTLRVPDPLIVLINNEPKTSKMECITKFEIHKPSGTPWFPSFSSPFNALFRTRYARGSQAAVDLCAGDPPNFSFITIDPDRQDPNKELSMSWWQSKHVQKRLDEQIDGAINAEAFRKIGDHCPNAAEQCAVDRGKSK